MLMKEF